MCNITYKLKILCAGHFANLVNHDLAMHLLATILH